MFTPNRGSLNEKFQTAASFVAAASSILVAFVVPMLIRPMFGSECSLFIALIPVMVLSKLLGWKAGIGTIALGLLPYYHPIHDGAGGDWGNLFVGGVFVVCGFGICWVFRSLQIAQSASSATRGQGLELVAKVAALEQQVGALQHQTGNLKTADTQKDEALAILGHELRNPLAPISSAAYLIRHSATPADRDKWSRVIEGQVLVLKRLVDDLLDIARLRQGKVNIRKATSNLSELVTRAAETCRSILDERRHQLYVGVPNDPPLYADVDPERIAQAVFNVIQNAAKYTEPGGTVWVTLEKVGDNAVIKVRDTGIGISADFLPYVWELFTQCKTGLDRDGGGIGLGLSLVKKLTELHGGSVSATSDGPGKGSEFTITLPCSVLAWRAIPKPTAPPAVAIHRRKVLIVEDNLVAAETLAVTLRLDGHQVSVVHDGVAAIPTAIQFQPDAILLDIGLPGIDGYEIARQLRAAGVKAVITAITGCSGGDQREQGRESGIDHYLLKPAELTTVRQILNDRKPEAGGGVGYNVPTDPAIELTPFPIPKPQRV